MNTNYFKKGIVYCLFITTLSLGALLFCQKQANIKATQNQICESMFKQDTIDVRCARF